MADKDRELTCRSIFFEDPGLSIDEAARILSERFRGEGLVKPDISRIRREVRQVIGLPQVPQEEMQNRLPPLPAFNPPRLVASKPETPVVAVTTPEERRRFCDDYILENYPNVTVDKVRQALIKRFGVAISPQYISNSIKAAKDAAQTSLVFNPPSVPTQEEPISEQGMKEDLDAILNTLKAAGFTVKAVLMNKDGTFKVEV
jgi:hypothetical protein